MSIIIEKRDTILTENFFAYSIFQKREWLVDISFLVDLSGI